MSVHSRIGLEFGNVGFFEERGKPEYPEKTSRSTVENQQQTQPTYDPGHISGRRVLSQLHQPCSPQELHVSLDINYWSPFVEYSHYPIACCCLPHLWNFHQDTWFFQHVDIRENYCSTSFAHLAIFQAIEFKDQPIPKTLGIFVCQTSESKASFTKCSIL